MITFKTQEECWNWLMRNLSQAEIRALYHEAYSILKNKEDASDALREALFRGAAKCNQLRNEDKLFQWMFTIVRNVSYGMHNKNTLQKLVIQTKLCFERSTWAESADAHMMKACEKEQIHRAIENLKSPGKEIVKMRIFKKMNFRAIAKELNMNYNSVRSTYHRVLISLKNALEDNNYV